MDNNILVPLELAEHLWFDNQDDPIELIEWKEYKFIHYDNLIEANNCNIINKLEEDKEQALEYLSEYANEYINNDSIRRITSTAFINEINIKHALWQAAYEEIYKMDNTAEYEAWFISWLNEWLNLLDSN